jgi:pimeloyl-ACP methyl ester carboxylesterase
MRRWTRTKEEDVRFRGLVASVLVATVATAALVQAQGAGLQTLEMGAGPTVVLVPGLGASRTDWLPTVKRLKERFHCVMVEIPGQGTSPLPDPFSLQTAAGALDAVVAKQKGDSTIIVGDGVGGVLALMSASAHPEHQRGVLLIDTHVKSPLQIQDQQREGMMRYIDENYDPFLQSAFKKMGRDSAESARLYAMMAAVPPVTVKAYIREMISMDANSDLRNLRVPLAMALTDSVWKPGRSWGACAKQLGMDDSTRVTGVHISNSGPMVMKDQPDSLAAIITAFAAKGFATKK